MYFYGAFFGGTREKMVNLCKTLKAYQEEDKKIPYEPVVNDESYINKEFHFNPPSKIVYTQNFKFGISDKGGMIDTRNPNKNIQPMLDKMLGLRYDIFEIRGEDIIKI
jgi:hypothetical protein